MSPRRMLSLEELMERVESALNSCSIQIVVWETLPDGFTPGKAHDDEGSLYRLTRCLRSHGVLNEYVTERKGEAKRWAP